MRRVLVTFLLILLPIQILAQSAPDGYMAFSQTSPSASACLLTLDEDEASSGAVDNSGAQQPAYADAGDPESVHCLAAPCCLSLIAAPWRPVGPVAFRSAQLSAVTPPWI